MQTIVNDTIHIKDGDHGNPTIHGPLNPFLLSTITFTVLLLIFSEPNFGITESDDVQLRTCKIRVQEKRPAMGGYRLSSRANFGILPPDAPVYLSVEEAT